MKWLTHLPNTPHISPENEFSLIICPQIILLMGLPEQSSDKNHKD